MKLYFTIILVMLACILTSQTMWDDALAVRESGELEWTNSATITTENNEIIHVWSETKYGDRDIFISKNDMQGNSLWGEEAILLANSIDFLDGPQVITTNDDAYIVIWQKNQTIQMQKINSTGTIIWSENALTITEQFNQNSVRIFSNNNGGAIVVWTYDSQLMAVSIDSNGNNLWEEDGDVLNLSSITAGELIISDGLGGLLAIDEIEDDESLGLNIVRIGTNGEQLWSQQLLSDIAIPEVGVHLKKAYYNNIDGYYILANGYNPGSVDLCIFKISFNGEIAEIQGTVPYYPSGFSSYTYAINNNGTLFVWKKANGNQLVYCFDNQLLPLWGENGLNIGAISYTTLSTVMDADNMGNLYVLSLKNSENPNIYYVKDVVLTIVDASGTIQTEAGGIILAEDVEIVERPFIQADDYMVTAWRESSDGLIKLKQFVLDDNYNEVLFEGNEVVRSTLSNGIYSDGLIYTYPTSDGESIITIWEDFRDFGDIMYQKVNTDASVSLTNNGIKIAEGDESFQYLYSSAQSELGDICIVWINEDDLIKTRMLNSDGILQGNDSGEVLYDAGNDGFEIYNLALANFDNEFYLSWIEKDNSTNEAKIKGLKTYQTNSYWGEEPFEITTIDDDSLFNLQMINNYCLHETSRTEYNLYKIEEDALVLSLGELSASGKINFACDEDNNLFYTWQGEDDKIYVQGITQDNNPFFSEAILVSYHPDSLIPIRCSNPNLLVSDALYIIWNQTNETLDYNVRSQKINFWGQKEWSQLGLLLSTAAGASCNLQKVNQDNLIALWGEDIDYESCDIKFNLISTDGSLPLGTEALTLASDIDMLHYLTSLKLQDQRTFIVWAQTWYWEDSSLFAQMIDFSAVSNESNDIGPITKNMLRNYPNPFNPETTISFNITSAGLTTLDIYNLKGQKVKTLVDEYKTAGKHTIVWNGENDQKKPVASGVYLYKIRNGKFSSTKKMILLK